MKKKNGTWIFPLIIMGALLMLTASCKKVSTSTAIKDGEGNVYTSVTIGTQVWLTENLKTTKYLNGVLIGTTTPATLDISGLSSPQYQWAYGGSESNVATYGRLYTWYAITDSRKVCPTGWHVPTDADWTTLTTYLGGELVAGGKLKETATTHWQTPNTGATDVSNFTALPGGTRVNTGTFSDIGNYGYWWSATENDAVSGWFRGMLYNGSDAYRSHSIKSSGFSVRCIKD